MKEKRKLELEKLRNQVTELKKMQEKSIKFQK